MLGDAGGTDVGWVTSEGSRKTHASVETTSLGKGVWNSYFQRELVCPAGRKQFDTSNKLKPAS